MEEIPTTAQIEASFPASAPGLGYALKEAESFCVARALPRDLVSRVLVVVEELFTNVIKYGYGGDSERPVRLGISVVQLRVTVLLEDEAPPFDPTLFRRASTERPDQGPEGLSGIALVLGLSARAEYQRLDTGNRLIVTVET